MEEYTVSSNQESIMENKEVQEIPTLGVQGGEEILNRNENDVEQTSTLEQEKVNATLTTNEIGAPMLLTVKNVRALDACESAYEIASRISTGLKTRALSFLSNPLLAIAFLKRSPGVSYRWLHVNWNSLKVTLDSQMRKMKKEFLRGLITDAYFDKFIYDLLKNADDYDALRPYPSSVGHLHRFTLLFVARGKCFPKLNFEQMQILLKSEFCGVNYEEEIFFIILHWINLDYENRIQYLVRLMKNVRFGYTTVLFNEALTQCFMKESAMEQLTRHENAALKAFVSDNKCRLLLDVGSLFQIVKVTQSDHESFARQIKMSLLPMYVKRDYIFDPNCPYHHLYTKHVDDVTPDRGLYDYFIDYLQLISLKDDRYPLDIRSPLIDQDYSF